MYATNHALVLRRTVDFDDLIRLALDALRCDQTLLERLRYRWPYVLEDEAQDSGRLQELILELLSRSTLAMAASNWVRRSRSATRPSTRLSLPQTRNIFAVL